MLDIFNVNNPLEIWWDQQVDYWTIDIRLLVMRFALPRSPWAWIS